MGMRGKGGERLPPAITPLIEREVELVLDGLMRAYPRALEDNPAGLEVLAEALRAAIRLGLSAGCEAAGLVPLPAPDDGAWDNWRRQRNATPEGHRWPAWLEAESPEVVDRAGALLEAAGAELGLRGRRLGEVGGQAAEAGHALVRSLTEPVASTPAPERAAPAEVGPPQPDGSVRVAVVANQAEAELLQGVLEGAGIPSTWRRTGGDLPELIAAGYREIYVPGAAAGDAQALLATLDPGDSDDEPPPVRRVGLERTGLRLIGKATIVLVLVGMGASGAIALAVDTTVGLLVLAALVIAIAAFVAWGELAARG